jgi:O-antigen/teichoic acid export membrane protein
MTYFVIFCLLIFLGVMLYIDVLKYFIGRGGSNYHEGLIIVPIVLIANMFYGIVFNLSIWFKLTDRTFSGTIISIIGASVTLLCLFILVPRIGYLGAAIAHLGCYTMMMLVSYFWGQKVFPVPYQVGRIVIYTVLAIGLFLISTIFGDYSLAIRLTINTLLILFYLGIVFVFERKNPLKI